MATPLPHRHVWSGKGAHARTHAHASAEQRKRARCGETMLPFAVGKTTAAQGRGSFVIYTHAMYERASIRRAGKGIHSILTAAEDLTS